MQSLKYVHVHFVYALYGASVNYSGNSSGDERTYQPYMEH